MKTKSDIVEKLVGGRGSAPQGQGVAFAPANVALSKYWGKRNQELNLPMTSSLSISMGHMGAQTEAALLVSPGTTPDGYPADEISLDDKVCAPDSAFARRVRDFLDLFRPTPQSGFRVDTHSTVPVAAGLASSASGFAALTMALDELFGWRLDHRSLSVLARLGSGSACRSILWGFVEWRAGESDDGMDSFGEPLGVDWPEFRLGMLPISIETKPISSREAMLHTAESSPLYKAWPAAAEADIQVIRQAINDKDFSSLGATAEANALAMHATMQAARPAINYWLPETLAQMRRICDLRAQGLEVYFTVDAGPNIKLLFLEEHTAAVEASFPTVEVVRPFP